MSHPRNLTRYKSLDKIAADSRVEEVRDEGPDGIWIDLLPGYRRESVELISFHEWTVKDLVASWNYAVRIGDIVECRDNPSMRKNPAAPRAAIAMYARFQGHEPKKLGTFFSGFKIPFAASLAGPAFNVMYRSDKNDPSTGKPVKKPIEYIHDHEKGVNVYRCDDKAGPADVAVPAFIRDVDALVLIGDCLGFTYEDEHGDAIDAEPTSPIPELYTIPSGRALVVVQSKRKVLALIWGGKLGVEARGIVY